MQGVIAIVAAGLVCGSSSAGFLSNAVIDDFGPGGPGLGFTRQASGDASVSGGSGSLSSGSGFGYLSAAGYDASAFSGISLKVSDLGSGTLELSIVGSSSGFTAMNVPLNGYVNDGYVWITFDQIDAVVSNEPGFISSSMASGEGIGGIGLSYSGGTGSVSIDDFEFRSSPVPAPGALALLGVAGIAGARRRR
ncbi:MAG: PEP-CTERM sorting domain-containing protein [Planctomycetes bacterium]|nr:PEP-CTERM sorting domain-containing protein [Planctomycetota bacterium]